MDDKWVFFHSVFFFLDLIKRKILFFIVPFPNINFVFRLPLVPAYQWGASAGKCAAIGWAQSTGRYRRLVLGGGLWHVPDGLYGREDQTKHTPSAEVLTGNLRSHRLIQDEKK